MNLERICGWIHRRPDKNAGSSLEANSVLTRVSSLEIYINRMFYKRNTKEPLPVNMENPTTGRKIRIFFHRFKKTLLVSYFRNTLKKFQQVHILVKS